MFRRPRQRRGPYALANETAVPPGMLRLVSLVIAATLIVLIGRWTLRALGIGNQVQRTSVVLLLDSGAQASVALDGGALKRAEDRIKLFSGDRIVANAGQLTLRFFDGTTVRLDTGGDLTIRDSLRGVRTSTLDLRLAGGTAWIATPALQSFSGSIQRSVTTDTFTMELPSDAELLMTERSVAVFASDGLGVSLDIDGGPTAVIGEGQEWKLPEGDADLSNPYAYRTPLQDGYANNPFLQRSRYLLSLNVNEGDPIPPPQEPTSSETLVVTEPQDDALVTGTTVRIAGTVGESVARVRVNGYVAALDPVRRTFSQELALPNDENVDIRIEALDARGLTLQESSRTIHRSIQPPDPPTITAPAPDGSVYRTLAQEFDLRGTAPRGVTGIIVNDYRLQLFKPGDGTWTYLASVRLATLKPGRNVYSVKSIDRSGNVSAPVELVVLLEEGEEGIVGNLENGSSSSAASSASSSLPNNAPLLPGSVTVTAPTPGTSHTATGSEVVIEGTTPPDARSVTVNGYRLQLFEPAKRNWTYIAREDWGTLKPGENTYEIVVRNAQDEILDRMTYTITK